MILVSRGLDYSYVQKPFPSPFPARLIKVGNIVFGAHDLGAIGSPCSSRPPVLFFRYTTLGLAARGGPEPGVCRLSGSV